MEIREFILVTGAALSAYGDGYKSIVPPRSQDPVGDAMAHMRKVCAKGSKGGKFELTAVDLSPKK